MQLDENFKFCEIGKLRRQGRLVHRKKEFVHSKSSSKIKKNYDCKRSRLFSSFEISSWTIIIGSFVGFDFMIFNKFGGIAKVGGAVRVPFPGHDVIVITWQSKNISPPSDPLDKFFKINNKRGAFKAHSKYPLIVFLSQNQKLKKNHLSGPEWPVTQNFLAIFQVMKIFNRYFFAVFFSILKGQPRLRPICSFFCTQLTKFSLASRSKIQF